MYTSCANSFVANEEIGGRAPLWPIRWIDLLDEILLFSILKGIFPDFRDYLFLDLRLIPASISDNHEVTEQTVLI
jgi:hypothetical protein